MVNPMDCRHCFYLDIAHKNDSYGYCVKYSEWIILEGENAKAAEKCERPREK